MPNAKSLFNKIRGKRTFSIQRNVVFALVGGLALGIGGTLAFQNYNPKDSLATSAPVVMQRIEDRNELVVAAENYNITEKAEDRNKVFEVINVPFTLNSFWYRFMGSVEARVDLSAAVWDPITADNVIRVKLPSPTLKNIPDLENSKVLEETNNLLNPHHVSDLEKFQRQCKRRSSKEAEESGIAERAKKSAEDNLQNMFDVACGKDAYKVKVRWIEPQKEAKDE